MSLFMDQAAAGGSSIIMIVIWVVVIAAMMYFMSRPQKKEEKRRKALMDSMEVGDTVLTTSGFYGVVIGVEDDTVVVEFGNNKNCRIPMQKAAITEVEKPEGYEPPVTEQPAAEPEKKGLFGKLKKGE